MRDCKEMEYRHVLEDMVTEYGLAECIIMLADATRDLPSEVWKRESRGIGKLYALGFDLQGE